MLDQLVILAISYETVSSKLMNKISRTLSLGLLVSKIHTQDTHGYSTITVVSTLNRVLCTNLGTHRRSWYCNTYDNTYENTRNRK